MIKSVTMHGKGGTSTTMNLVEIYVTTEKGSYIVSAKRLELYIRGDRSIKPNE